MERAIDQAGSQETATALRGRPPHHSGSPSNRIDNSGTAAPCSLHANKFTIQTWTNALKQNIRTTDLLSEESGQHWREVQLFMVLLMC